MNMKHWCGILLLLVGAAWSAPYQGYVYPAGGRQGTTVRVTIGGQRINGIRSVFFSGTGITATLVDYEGAGGKLNAVQRDLLRKRIDAIIDARKGKPATPPAAKPPAATPPAATPATPPATTPATAPTTTTAPKKEVTLPDLPDLRDLEQKTNAELWRLYTKYVSNAKRTKPPLAEVATLEITIAPDAAPGDRELRLISSQGLSNPLTFQVGATTEVQDRNPDDDKPMNPPAVEAPALLNGRIMPGEVDRFPLTLRAGQRLTIAMHARRLIPYLADGVPGWCQGVLTLYDAAGQEVGYAFNTSFDPDPTLFCTVPADGAYTLAVRDALYRGREDFVYRVSVREQVPGDALFTFTPLAVLAPDALPAAPTLPWVQGPMAVVDEAQPHATAQKIALPQVINGRIGAPNEIDAYSFAGKAGDTVVAEVYARRLDSPMDALLRLVDPAGKVVAWNDDSPSPEMGLLTHSADARVLTKLPADGVYTVQVSDVQRHGGDAHRYALRVSAPQGDFALCVTPSGIGATAGGSTTVTVYAYRKDGWTGDINLALVDAPAGITLKETRIPADKNEIKMTVTLPKQRFDTPVALRLQGTAQIDGKTIVRPAIAAERLMQAFAYYHLVPAGPWLAVTARR